MSKYDNLIKIYNERGINYCTPLDLTIPYIRENLSDSPGNILDLGCGSGKVIEQILDLNPSKIVGVDFSSVRIAHAPVIKQATFIHQEILEFLQGCKDKYDIVFLFEVLEHLYDDLEVMNLVQRVCPDGALLASVPIDMEDECHIRIFKSAREIIDRYGLRNYEQRTVRGSERIVFRKDIKNGRYKDLQSQSY